MRLTSSPHRGRTDDYYLAEGAGVAERLSAGADGRVQVMPAMDGDAYQARVAAVDPRSGVPRGRLRQDQHALRFAEVVVNGPKSWSIAAVLAPDIAGAHAAAQDRAAVQIVAWLGQHASTWIGPRGAQVSTPVERIEAAAAVSAPMNWAGGSPWDRTPTTLWLDTVSGSTSSIYCNVDEPER